MAAGKHNFTVEQGTTTSYTLVYKDTSGNPIDLTGYSAQLQIRPTFADLTNEKYLTLSSSLDVDGSGLIITPTSGSIQIFISAQKTDNMTFNEAIYDLEIYSGSYVSRVVEGKFKIKKSVTR